MAYTAHARTQCLRRARCQEARRLLASAREAAALGDPSAPAFWQRYYMHRQLCKEGLIKPAHWPSLRDLAPLVWEAVLREGRREWVELDIRGTYEVNPEAIPVAAGEG